MEATQALLAAACAALGADTTTLAGVLRLAPVKVPIAPGPDLTVAAGDLANFDGSTPITITAATRTVSVDPATGEPAAIIPPPAGGVKWATTGSTALPQTIYGVVLGASTISFDAPNLLGAFLLDPPVTLTATGQFFEADADNLNFRLTRSAFN